MGLRPADLWSARLQTYEKRKNYANPPSIVLLQDRVLIQHKMSGFCELGAFFRCGLGDEKSWTGEKIVDRRDHGEEEEEYSQEEVGAILSAAQEDEREGHRIYRNKRQRNGAVREATVEQEMVDMVPVRAEGGSAVKDANAENSEGIQQRYHQDGEADSRGCSDWEINIGGVGDIDEFDHEDCIDRTDEQATGVAHKDFRGLKIEDQERHEAAGEGESDHRIWKQPHIEKIGAEDDRGQQTETTCQAIDAIDQIKGVDDYDDGEIGKQEAEHLRQLIDAEESVHTSDLDISIVDDDECRQNLTDKFFHWRDDQNIVLETEEENDKGCSYKILKISELIKVERQETAEDEAGEDAYAAQGRYRRQVDFPGIGHIEKLFHFGHIDNRGYGQEGNSK
jgi:hypothetical protein